MTKPAIVLSLTSAALVTLAANAALAQAEPGGDAPPGSVTVPTEAVVTVSFPPLPTVTTSNKSMTVRVLVSSVPLIVSPAPAAAVTSVRIVSVAPGSIMRSEPNSSTE